MSGLDVMTGEITHVPVSIQEQLERRVAILENDKRMLVEDLLGKDRTIAGLRAQLARQTAESPHQQAMKGIAEYYRARLHKTKAWKFGEKRQKAVLARLNEGTDPAKICRGVDWLAEHAYVSPDNGQRYDDLELACRNEVNVDRYADLAQRNNVPTLLDEEWFERLGAKDRSFLRLSEDDPKSRGGGKDTLQMIETDPDIESHN